MAIRILTAYDNISDECSRKVDILVTTSWDDGHPSDFRLAELLHKYGLRGTSYIPINNAEHTVLDKSGIRALSETGLEIGGHTYNHVRIDRLSYSDAREEVVAGKRALEDVTGRTVSSFCYPRGKFSRRARRAVRDAGFTYARTTQAFHTAPSDDRLLSPVTEQLFEHSTRTHVGHCVKEANWSGLANCLRILVRAHTLSDQIQDHIKMAEINGGILHIWGHSWELDEQNLWPQAETIFELLANIRGARFLTNSELNLETVANR